MTSTFNSAKIIRAFTSSLSPNKSAVNVMAEVLHVSVDVAYRRLNGKVDITLDEAVKLCEYSSLSMDKVFELKENEVYFSHLNLYNPYDAVLSGELTSFINNHILNKKDDTLYLASAGFPVGYLFSEPNLIHFRRYHLLNDKTCFEMLKPFSIDRLRVHTVFNEELEKLYQGVDTCEFWCENTFSDLIGEIKYYKSLGLLSVEETKTLINDFKRLLHKMENFAEEGKKKLGGAFELYVVPYNISSSVYLSTCPERKICFLEMNFLDYAYTTNEDFCNKQKKWFKRLMNYSTCISKSNLKERRSFFEKVHEKLDGI